jgi:hypothetical protein
MSQITLNPYVAQSSSNFTVGQTIREFLGTNGEIGWASEANFNNPAKKVTVKLVKDGNTYFVATSKPLSDLCRSKEVTLGHILDFHLTQAVSEETGETIVFIGLPASATTATYKASELKAKAFSRKSTFIPEELIA